MLAYIVRVLPVRRTAHAILDVAPHQQVRRAVEAAFPKATYVSLDLFEPERSVDVLADITRLPFATSVFDLIVCYHVLEHVPDDRAAMREIARLLSPQGLGIIQVPYRTTGPTDEDPILPAPQRAVRFGQADHVRHYGTDFDERLREAGLAVQRRTPDQFVEPTTLAQIGSATSEPVWLVSRERDVTDALWPTPKLGLQAWRQLAAPLTTSSGRRTPDQRPRLRPRLLDRLLQRGSN